MIYDDIRRHIKNGDLIAVRGRGLFAAAIRLVTGSPYTHTAVALWFGDRLLVAETRGGVAAFSPLSQHRHEDFDVIACPLSRPAVSSAALALLGEPIRYDYLDLARLAANKLLGVPLPREDKRLVCSALSLAIYLAAGFYHPRRPRIPTPGEVVTLLGGRLVATHAARED